MTDQVNSTDKPVTNKAQDNRKLPKAAAIAHDLKEIAQANSRACIESGKIAASGLTGIGRSYVEHGRSMFDKITGELKGLSTIKSPMEFYALQGKLFRENLEASIEFGSQQRNALLKLTEEATAPIKQQVGIVAAKVTKRR